MFGLSEFLISVLLIYCAISRVVPKFLRWIIKRWYHIEARIGRIGVPYMSLHDVHLSANGFTVEIDQIGFRSSFLSSEVTKLVSVIIHDVRVNKDMMRQFGHSSWRPPESVSDVKIPPLIITIAQFVSVRLLKVTCAVVGESGVFHCTLSEVNVDASVVHSTRSLLISAGLGSLSARLLRQAAPKPSLTHLAASLVAEATLIATTPLTVKKIDIIFKDIKTVVGDDFFTSPHWSKEERSCNSTSKLFNYKLFINNIAPILPKGMSLSFDKCVVMDAQDRDITTLNKLLICSTFTPQATAVWGINACAGIQILMDGLDMRSASDTYLVLSRFSLDAKLEQMGITSEIFLKDFSAFYDQNKMNWISEYFNSFSFNKNEGDELLSSDIQIKTAVELQNISGLMKFPNLTPIGLGFSRLKFLYDSLAYANGGKMYELLSENLWCQLNKISNISTLRKEHIWGTAVYLGIILVNSSSAKSEAMVDIFRLEWSPPFAEILSALIRETRCFLKKRCYQIKGNEKYKFNFKISFASTNLFFTSEHKICLMMRIDNGCAERDRANKICFDGEGIKFISLEPTTKTFICSRSQDIKGSCAQTDGIRFEWSRNERLLIIKLSRNIFVQWNPNLHLKLMEMYYNFKRIGSELKNDRVHSDYIGLKVYVILRGNVKIGLKLSKQHHFIINTDDFTYSHSIKDCSWSSSMLKIAVDGADIFGIEAIKFALLHDNEFIKSERVGNEEFIQPWNKTWHIAMKSVKAIFPYEHNFSSAVQDDLITVIKWLKCLHKTKSSLSYDLPRDLFIEIKEFLFEMSDDPFEVRLRDNYELLEDEYKENLKRQKMLEEKINEMCKTHLLMPAGKVDELYNSLSVLSAGIYVKRSKQMKEQGTRTRLFAWIISDFHLLALVDPSIHGPENVVNNMTQIDPDSPWPSDGLEFSTLWCRSVVVNCKELKYLLRDFPQPWLNLGCIQMWGKIVGAEQIPTKRAKRVVQLDLGDPWGNIDIERAMTPLKIYHDLNCEIEHFSYAFGPCWEPVIAQCNLSFEKIIRGSLDPSPPLPLWDKLRLLFHGRVTMLARQLTVLLHASLDPYNKTEEMEITWSSVVVDWTNAKVVFKGDLDIYVRTASKYDDCRLLHLPNLRLSIKINWVCLGDPNDHHSVMPCAPDKLPDYSSNQEHDSFRAFRSQNLNISLALETKPISSNNGIIDNPVALLYGSTLRWFENLKLILSGVTRPTRRGMIFKNVRPRKLPLSRHYRRVHLLLSLHTFQVHYWMSFAMQRGFELTGESIAFSSEHFLSLVPINDGLKHRPRSEWSVIYMTCELGNAEIWLRSALHSDKPKEKVSLKLPVEKCYFLSVGKVSYGREASGMNNVVNPTHRLVVYGLKGAWTTSNRDVVFALFDTFIKTKQLKKNLSTEALRAFRNESNRNINAQTTIPTENLTAPLQNSASSNIQATPSPMSKLQCGQAATMLQQLIAEADTKAVVFSDETITEPNEQQLQGLAACQHMDDVIHKNWSIALVNSQVLLKGPETKGYIIISASKAEILQRVHRPLWKDRTLVTKTTWVGSLQSMQYYATVSAGESDSLDENIMWLSVDNIKEKDDCVIAELPDVPQIVGSGQSVGGVVSETVGASSVGNNPPLQLQRIVSRCKCEFFYVSYGESSMSSSSLAGVPTPPPEDSSALWENHHPPVDAFTLMHHDLEVCTNSLQYAMLLDIVNNLLLYVETSRKKAFERLQRMRFQLQLQSIEDQRKPIQETQTRVRALLCKLRALEREMYLVQRTLADEPNSPHLQLQMDNLERQVYNCKEALNGSSEELDTMLSCYKETQLIGQKMATLRGDKAVSVVRSSEICFKHAQWRLTEADGQLGIADLVLSNFLYTKKSKSDDSVEHLLELGYVKMSNLLPNQIYKEVLQPTEIHNNMPIDRKRALRVFCREKAPVGGISVKEHFEINLVPLTIGLTKKFYNKMLKFCFPERETEEGDISEDGESGRRSKVYPRGKETNFYVPIERKDDVEKMKERAEKNKLFIYIKIPEVPVHVSYKGTKEKNLEDIRDFSLIIPTLEYHNVTWTWLDLLLAMKSDSRKVILSQAIKQKLQIKIRTGTDEGASPQEEDKARMLFGNRHVPGENKSFKKKFKFPK